MYCTYYNLTSLPFEINPDPKFLWLGKKYGEALAAMQYGITANKGFICLTGDVGTGKTTIVNALANSMKNNFIFAKIPDPSLNSLDFFNFTAKAFEMNKTFNSKGEFLGHLEKFLDNADADSKNVALIIEEAQSLNQQLLEEIRLLSNIEKPDKKLINILFVGQNEFNNLLSANKALRQRITVSCRIEPLTEIETEKYILHRLKVAGSESRIFSAGAVQEVFFFSEGNPRLINIICDLALLSGYVQETKIIGSEIIRECTANVLISNQKGAEVIKDPKTLAKTIQETRKSELARLKDTDSVVAEKVPIKSARRADLFKAAIALLFLTCILGWLYYFDRYNAFTGNIKSSLVQSSSLHPAPPSEVSYPELQMVKNTNSGNDISKLSANQGQPKALIPETEEIPIARLKSRNDKLSAELKEMLAAKQQTAALENVINKRDIELPKLEQKIQELEKKLNQKKNSNGQLKNQLSEKSARVIELEKQLKASRSNYNKLEDEVVKSKKEIAQLQDQLSELKTKQAAAAISPVVLQMQKKPPAKDDVFQKETESPHPAAIIEWVLKKKSE
jgi:type II secretory pathway predicted ATPase ExeA/predicted  nucleic acid-binding Zn-ribbon protein